MNIALPVLLLTSLFFTFPQAQEPVEPERQQGEVAEAEAPHPLAEIDAVIEEVYASVSFEKGEVPDWKRLENTLMEGATFVQPPRRGQKREIISTADFVQLFKDDVTNFDMSATGFWERVVHTTTTEFGDTATCLVVFEVRVEKDSEQPMGRGLDSISLVRRDGRWWITSIITEWERPGRPLPKSLLGQA